MKKIIKTEKRFANQAKCVFRMRIVLIFCWTFAPLLLLPFLVGSDPICKTPHNALTGWNSQQFLSTFICLAPLPWNMYMQVSKLGTKVLVFRKSNITVLA